MTHDYSIEHGLKAIKKNNPLRPVGIKKEVKIGTDTFIGQRCIIMPGITIGDNCIIGTGSIVTKDIPSNSVAYGFSAKNINSTENWIINKMKEEKDFII